MTNKAVSRPTNFPTLFEDFFKPWSQWFDDGAMMSRAATVPAVNIKENADAYLVSLAAPGLKKEDIRIDVDENRLTIRSEKEDTQEENTEKFTRKEYSYSSFTRSFNLPEDVKPENIEARYENGELNITLPRKVQVKAEAATKQITVK